MMPPAGSSALVTGGLGGIGQAIGRALAEHGVHVVLADLPSETPAPQVDGVTVVACDVTDAAAWSDVVRHVDSIGSGLSAVVLNAGLAPGGSPDGTLDLDRYRQVMAVNVDGVVLGLDAVVPTLRRRGGGSIVATASIAGLIASPTDPVYAASKHAVVGLVRALGPALVDEGIRIAALCPGVVETGIIGHVRDAVTAAGIPLLTPEETAAACLRVLDAGTRGQAWFVQPGRASEPFRFRGLPGPRNEVGHRVGGVPTFDGA